MAACPKGTQVNGTGLDHQERQETLPTQATNLNNSHQQYMDGLYMSLLKEAFKDPGLIFQGLDTMLILWSAACIQEPLYGTSLARLLQLNRGQNVILAPEPLGTLLYTTEEPELVTATPASFSDFIFSERSNEYTRDKPEHHGLLAQRCFELMQDQLGFNICGFGSSLTRDYDGHDLDERVNTIVSEELYYSCRYWGTHLRMSAPDPSLLALLHRFTSHYLLVWLEVLNLKHAITRGAQILVTVGAWLREHRISSEVVSLVHDAWKFTASFAAIPARASTPHIYISALASWPSNSPISQAYRNLICDIVSIDGVTVKYTHLYARENLDPLLTCNTGLYYPGLISISADGAFQLNTSTSPEPPISKSITKFLRQDKSVGLITVTPDNNSIISASGNLSICKWDRKTGKGLTRPFYIRTACLGMVAFSFDRKQIATASSDGDVFIWDTSSGKFVAGPFQGHRSWVTAIAFSPDDAHIVSGGRDRAILVWDISAPGTPVLSLEGHDGYLLSLCFSPQGSHIISASTDNIIRVWDIRKGSSSLPLLFNGHTDCVRSIDVSRSSAGILVVSGSDDRTIRIWDLFTGKTVSILGPIEGRSNYVLCVKFSPNGQNIASGSQDGTIRVWDVRTGKAVAGPFTGHTGRVNTVTFSMDGTQVISGSHDGTIRVWDVNLQNSRTRGAKKATVDSPPPADSGAREAWKLKADGWVVDKDERPLIWIPPASHYAIRPQPADHLLIPRFDLPISQLLEGKAWKELCRRQKGKSIKADIQEHINQEMAKERARILRQFTDLVLSML